MRLSGWRAAISARSAFPRSASKGVSAYPGRHRVYANAACYVIQSCNLGEPDDAVLGRCVAGGARHADQAADGRRIDDGAAALRQKRRDLRLQAIEDAREVYGQLPRPVI